MEISEDIKIALKETETMDGLIIEGNNFKVMQFLSLREHLINMIEKCKSLEESNTLLRQGALI